MIAPLDFPRGDSSRPKTQPQLRFQIRQPKATGPAFVDARIFLPNGERLYASNRGVTLSHHELDDVIEFLQAAKEATR